jgi:ribosome-associated translation inhibitor RaiA
MPLSEREMCSMYRKMFQCRSEAEGYQELYSISHNPRILNQAIISVRRILDDSPLLVKMRDNDEDFYNSYVTALRKLEEILEKEQDRCQ